MVFEIREEQTILIKGLVEVREVVIGRIPKDQIKESFHNMEVGHRRNTNEDEDFSGDRIYSVVRVK